MFRIHRADVLSIKHLMLERHPNEEIWPGCISTLYHLLPGLHADDAGDMDLDEVGPQSNIFNVSRVVRSSQTEQLCPPSSRRGFH